MSLSTAMAQQQAGSKLAALYNDGNDADLPALYDQDDDDPVRSLMEQIRSSKRSDVLLSLLPD